MLETLGMANVMVKEHILILTDQHMLETLGMGNVMVKEHILGVGNRIKELCKG